MPSVYITEAQYQREYKILLKFNTGESGEVDLASIIYKYEAARPIRDTKLFAEFYLDSWPTLAWECGFDISPEYLYYLVTGKSLAENASQTD